MRFFADENLERPIIESLRQEGRDVATIEKVSLRSSVIKVKGF